jgi:hypothetical protein
LELCFLETAVLEHVMTFIDNMAVDNKVTPEQITHSTLAHLPETGLMEEPGAQQVQMMAILYVVLNSPLNRPGAIYQYAADEEITAVVTVSEDRVYIDLEGRNPLRH